MKRAFITAGAMLALLPPGATAAAPPPPQKQVHLNGRIAAMSEPAPGVQRIEYRFGPITVTPGQNYILIVPNDAKPAGNGYITRMQPDLKRIDGSVPDVDVIHLHHGVWLTSRGGRTGENRFFASGEEKTILDLPAGYGYPVRSADRWLMNHMIHNLTTGSDNVYMTYVMDFIPAESELAKTIKPAYPLWMDVQNGSAYPVFDTKRGSGTNGKFTYPDDAKDPYGDGRRKNEWTAPFDGTIITGFGHVHPGGLHTDLEMQRPGQKVHDRVEHARIHTRVRELHKRGHPRLRKGRDRARRHQEFHDRLARFHKANHPRVFKDRLLIHRSRARYFDPNGPVSWDMSMEAVDPDWRVGVKKGDKLFVSGTYETERASWYESMGIGFYYWAPDVKGPDPFADPPDPIGEITHGHLKENENYGGAATGLPDPAALKDGTGDSVDIVNFQYRPGDMTAGGSMRNPPVVAPGQPLKFRNYDAAGQIYHSITACKPPCNRSTGISYPLADGPVDFDSGQLGYGPRGLTAAAQRDWWDTPTDLKEGTYTFFCRVHPFMRGAFRVKRPASK